MDLVQFLELFVITRLDMAEVTQAAATVGGFIFAAIEFFEWIVMVYRKQASISNDLKRQMAVGMAILLPTAAYLALVGLTDRPFDLNGIFLSAAFGIVVAKSLHDILGRVTGEAIYKAAAKAQDKPLAQIEKEAEASGA